MGRRVSLRLGSANVFVEGGFGLTAGVETNANRVKKEDPATTIERCTTTGYGEQVRVRALTQGKQGLSTRVEQQKERFCRMFLICLSLRLDLNQ